MIDIFKILPDLFRAIGLQEYYAVYFGLALNSILIIIIAYVLRVLFRSALLFITERISDKTKFKFDDFLVKNHFFRNSARIAPLYF